MDKHYLNRTFVSYFFSSIIFIGLLFLAGCAALQKNLPEKAKPRHPEVQVHNITALLPIKNGDLATSGKAIRDGLLAAYYADPQKQNGRNINIKIVDTSEGDINTLYDQAVVNGADFIIGPLTKPEVNTLASRDNLPLPTLALNTLDNYKSKVVYNLYQFGLSPQDEALQAAEKMSADGRNHIAIIAPDNQWGKRIAATFANKYKEKGGQIAASLYYNQNMAFDTQIKDLLKTGESAKQNNKKNSIPVPRNDIDGFFLIATPQNGRQIVPLLKFYYVQNIPPIYSISNIYSGVPNPNLDQDLNSVIFCDLPWVISPTASLPPRIQKIYNQVTTEWQSSFASNSRFYALGADAYHVVIYFNNLAKDSSVKIRGATGTLSIDNYNHVYRTLKWAQMQNGVPAEL